MVILVLGPIVQLSFSGRSRAFLIFFSGVFWYLSDIIHFLFIFRPSADFPSSLSYDAYVYAALLANRTASHHFSFERRTVFIINSQDRSIFSQPARLLFVRARWRLGRIDSRYRIDLALDARIMAKLWWGAPLVFSHQFSTNQLAESVLKHSDWVFSSSTLGRSMMQSGRGCSRLRSSFSLGSAIVYDGGPRHDFSKGLATALAIQPKARKLAWHQFRPQRVAGKSGRALRSFFR